jgi:hypothetical protein
MSIEALNWALSQKIDRSSAKFVLVAMANCANEDMKCWPSIAYLSEATCQDRKTVVENIKRLKELGIISDTDSRMGKTLQVPVFSLNKEYQNRNSSEIGTVPKKAIKSPVFPYKESRFSVETVPKTGHGTIKEPLVEPSGTINKREAPKNPELELLHEIPQNLAKDFLRLRKSKNLPLTQTAFEGIQREAAKAGLSLEDTIRACCEYGWAGFNAKWYFERNAKTSKPTTNRHPVVDKEERSRGAKSLLGFLDYEDEKEGMIIDV